MANNYKSSDKWKFFLRRNGTDFHFENENFSYDLVYCYCCDINSPTRTYSQPMHKHPNYELQLVLDGEFTYETEDKQVFSVKKGEFALHPPGFNHRIISETSVFSKLTMLFYVSPKEVDSAVFYHVAEKRIRDNKVFSCNNHVNTIVDAIIQLSEQHPHEYNTSFFFLSLSLVLEIFRIHVGSEKLDADLKYKDERINNSIEVIKSRISATLKVPDVAKSVHMSTRQFTKVFTETVGVSPGTYIKNYRSKYIRKLLDNSDLSIGDIANVMSYPDAAALIKAFKRTEGVTPAKYRKMNKK